MSPLSLLGLINLKNILRATKKIWSINRSSLSRRLSNLRDKSRTENKTTNLIGLHEKIYKKGGAYTIKTIDGDITIFPANKKLELTYVEMLFNDWIAIKLWLGLFLVEKHTPETC